MQLNFFCFSYLPFSGLKVVKYINLLSYPELKEKINNSLTSAQSWEMGSPNIIKTP